MTVGAHQFRLVGSNAYLPLHPRKETGEATSGLSPGYHPGVRYPVDSYPPSGIHGVYPANTSAHP